MAEKIPRTNVSSDGTKKKKKIEREIRKIPLSALAMICE
jgi:hypothetical protein